MHSAVSSSCVFQLCFTVYLSLFSLVSVSLVSLVCVCRWKCVCVYRLRPCLLSLCVILCVCVCVCVCVCLCVCMDMTVCVLMRVYRCPHTVSSLLHARWRER